MQRRESLLDAPPALQPAFAGANFIHRYLWKYQGWLNGCNGGPVRQPAMKLNCGQMRRVVDGLIASGIIDGRPTDLAEYFAGRNPKWRASN